MTPATRGPVADCHPQAIAMMNVTGSTEVVTETAAPITNPLQGARTSRAR